MRSCASDIQISVYDNPWYLSGACSRSTSAPRSGAHLADRRAEAAGAAVGDGVKQPLVACLKDHVERPSSR